MSAHVFDPAAGRSRAGWESGFEMSLDRRQFLQVLGAGVIWVVTEAGVWAQARRPGAVAWGEGVPLGARLHLGEDGTITLFCGKVECGQGARTELTLAAAGELRVSPEQIRVVLADTAEVPDDGITAGSRTTPSTVPAVRRAAAAAREWLRQVAARQWQVDKAGLEVQRTARSVIRHRGARFATPMRRV